MPTEAENADRHKFGDNRRACGQCGIPKEFDKFTGHSVVCKACTTHLMKIEGVVVTPEDHHNNAFRGKLSELRKNSEPQIVNGIQSAVSLLGRTPQEIAAECVNAMLDPAGGRSDLTPEQIAAIPIDYKTVGGFLKMLQEAQIFHDKQLEGNNPFDDVDAEELRSVILQGTIDQAQDDRELRLQLIRAFADRCNTFFDEVLEVAKERENQKAVISAGPPEDETI